MKGDLRFLTGLRGARGPAARKEKGLSMNTHTRTLYADDTHYSLLNIILCHANT